MDDPTPIESPSEPGPVSVAAPIESAPAPAGIAATLRALPWPRIAIGAAVLVALLLLGRRAATLIPAFAGWVEGLGPVGPLVFVVGYALAVVGFVPASLLTLAAGAVFGLVAGTFYVFVAATVGATAAFVVSRYFARAAIERRIEGDERFAAIDRAVGREGRRIVFLLRLSPAIPFNLLNYALGLTQVRLSDYVVACLGMLPGTLLYVYAGKVVGDVAAAASGQADTSTANSVLIGVGLVATVIVTVYVTRIARRALDEATEATGS